MTAWSLLIAVLLVFTGFLLGMDPQIGGAVHDVFGVGSSVGDHALQQEVIDKLEQSYYKEIDPEVLQVGAIDGMLAGLDDPYTVYMDPEEYTSWKEQTSGSYSGVGIVVAMKDHLVTAAAVFEESPAAAAGIEQGDVVLAVDGVSSEGRTLDQVVGDIKGPADTTVVLKMWRPAVTPPTTTTATSSSTTTTTDARATEDEGDPTVDLSGLTDGGESKDYTLTRKEITIPSTDSETRTVAGKKVALISLYQFAQASADDLRAEVTAAVQIDKVAAIILDLRSNPGGLLTSAIDVASIFIDTGVIVSTQGLHYAKEVLSATGDAFVDVPLYVLVDEYSASASEIVSGALQDHRRATLVGETTFGKGLVQTLESLSNGGAIKVTTQIYLTPNGRDINATGITPDVVAPDDPQTADVDEGLEAVLDLIAGASGPR